MVSDIDERIVKKVLATFGEIKCNLKIYLFITVFSLVQHCSSFAETDN